MISQKGIDFIKREEGFEAESYLDTGGVWTIGYGTILANGKPVCKGQTCTEKEAEKWLVDHVKTKCDQYLPLVKVPLTQNQTDALYSFIYNLGGTAFSKSTLLKKLNAADYIGAGEEFLKWCYDNGKKVQGLLNRRQRERALFLS